jgi:fructose-1,6-bisphosphatase/inositol monophosphatase family enzyme
MSLAISADDLYTLSKSSTVNLTVAASASALPHRHRHQHQHQHQQWQRLADFVFKIHLSSSAAIKLVALCSARLLATLNDLPVLSH